VYQADPGGADQGDERRPFARIVVLVADLDLVDKLIPPQPDLGGIDGFRLRLGLGWQGTDVLWPIAYRRRLGLCALLHEIGEAQAQVVGLQVRLGLG
jgi:hypothetical protein